MTTEFNGTPSPAADAPPVSVTEWLPAPVSLPPRWQEFAIGDVHGHPRPLAALLDAMNREAGPASHLTLLGDLVDRGRGSLAALRLAADAARTPAIATRTMLLGNHEMMMLMALSGRDDATSIGALWVANGGWTTLAEAGLSGKSLARDRAGARARVAVAAGEEVMALVEGAPLHRRIGNLVLVHAGIDPDLPLDAALDRPRLDADDARHPAWIREPFLHHEAPFDDGVIVVHGHTPEVRVLDAKGRAPVPGWHRLDFWRLGLDGGSYGTGIVAGAEFRDGAYRVFTASDR